MPNFLENILTFILSPDIWFKRRAMNKEMKQFNKELEKLKNSGASSSALNMKLDEGDEILKKYKF